MREKRKTLDKKSENLNLKNISKKQKFQERGITLIALVVTIVILLILSGVTLNIALSDNGLFDKTKKAAEDYEIATDEEQRKIAMLEAAMNLNGTEYKSTYNGKEVTVPIPAGFAVSEVEGENSVEDGLVIIDSKGNEFVWIPCSSEEYVGANWNDGWKKWMYRDDDDIEWSDPQTEVGVESLTKLEQKSSGSVGFYVARYEAGIPDEADFYADSEGDTYYDWSKKDVDSYNPVSKRGVQAWNCLSRNKALRLSIKMYSDNKSISSYLIDSHAWNYICNKIIAGNADDGTSVDESSRGNYKDSPSSIYRDMDVLYAYHAGDDSFFGGDFQSNERQVYHKGRISEEVMPGNDDGYLLELSTGASEKFKVYNIYDMAGNVCEYTTEIGVGGTAIGDHIKTVVRGGSFKEKR